MEWHDIAMPTGSPASGSIGLHLNIVLPECDSQRPATDGQTEALMRFYRRDFPGVTSTQAHALLSARNFAIACAQALWPKWNVRIREQMAAGLAAFIVADDQLRQFAVNWADAAFKRGSANPRVRGGPVFPEVQAFADYLAGMLELEGWTEDILRSSSFQ